jgi:hypothetical protein
VDHEGGKDPTPQGRIPHQPHQQQHPKPEDYESEKYHNSVPGNEVKKDGVYFFGYKRENAYPPERTEV